VKAMANEKNLIPFKKGEDKRRNVKGRPPGLPSLKESLTKLLFEEKDNKTAIEQVLTVLLNRALKGDIRAIQELLDRYYGKVSQKIDSNVSGNGLNITPIEWIKIEDLREKSNTLNLNK